MQLSFDGVFTSISEGCMRETVGERKEQEKEFVSPQVSSYNKMQSQHYSETARCGVVREVAAESTPRRGVREVV